ncbi:MAG TPA: SfnB family sulfur acquisition oxidoreductase [Solirubrobacterales bacterium]|nr:SfnB family sulfur acquisition oxidoreductase [Solirubrobacterales bacterium]
MSPATLSAAHRIESDAEAIAVAERFAAEIAPGAGERDRSRAVPIAELEQLGASGLLALSVPPDYGGPGLGATTIVEVFRIISAADPSIGQVPQNHYEQVDAVRRYGSAVQRQLFLSEIAAGARFGNAQSERGGKDLMDMRTELRAGPDGELRLNGVKYYSTGALTAQWIPVLAKTGDEAMAWVYLPREVEGLEVGQDWTAFGQRATISGTTSMTEVRVEPEWVLPLPERERAETFAAFAQVLHAAVDVGIARAALKDAARFLTTRSRPWFEAGVERPAEEPYVVVQFGRLRTQVRAAEALLADAARLLDAAAADPSPEQITAARLGVAEARAFGAETALAVSSDALDSLGSSAADEGHGLDRHWRNARTHTLHDPTRWKHVHLGRYVLDGVVPPPDSILF